MLAVLTAMIPRLSADLSDLERKEEAAIADCRKNGGSPGADFWQRRWRAAARLRAAERLIDVLREDY